MHALPRLTLSLLLLSACVDADDELALSESSAALALGGRTPSGFATAAIPSMFRGTDWRVQITGLHPGGWVAWDIEAEPGRWGAPNLTVVGATALGSDRFTAIQQANGKTVVFAIASETLYRTEQVNAYGRYWTSWTTVGTAMPRQPSFARNQDGRLEGVYVGTDGRVKQLWQQSPNGPWSAPYDTGVATNVTPEIARDAANRLEIFVPTPDVPPCGFRSWRQRSANGWAGWTAPGLTSTACLDNLAVSYAGDVTDVLAQTRGGPIVSLRRPASTIGFSSPIGVFNAGPLAQVGAPTFVRKDDGRILAFTGHSECPWTPGSCGTYFADERTATGGWTGFGALATSQVSTPSMVGADAWVNRTVLLAADGTGLRFDRMVLQ